MVKSVLNGFISKLRSKDPVVYGSSVVFVGNLVASIVNYLSQIVLGRMLTPSEYGTLNALVSLSLILQVPSGLLGNALIKISSELGSLNLFDKLSNLFWKLIYFTSLLGIAFCIVFFLFLSNISAYLNIDDYALLSVFALFVVVSFFRSIPLSILQGLLRYKGYAFVSIASNIMKLSFAIVFILLGFSVSGALFGFVVSATLTVVVGYFVLAKNLPKSKFFQDNLYLKKLASFSVPTTFVQFGLMCLTNIDVILVKKYFADDIAGYYAGTVNVGKMMLFGTGILTNIMFPQIASLYAKKLNYTNRFKRFFLLQILLISASLGVYILFPGLLVTIFFGKKFIHSVDYLPVFSVFVALYVLIAFMTKFMLAIEENTVCFMLIIAASGQFVLLNMFHASLYQVISVNIVVTGILCLCLLLFYIFNIRSSLSQTNNYLQIPEEDVY